MVLDCFFRQGSPSTSNRPPNDSGNYNDLCSSCVRICQPLSAIPEKVNVFEPGSFATRLPVI